MAFDHEKLEVLELVGATSCEELKAIVERITQMLTKLIKAQL